MAKLLVPFLLLAALIGATFVGDRRLPKADFTFINRGDVNTLDLQRMSWMQDLRVAHFLWEGLVKNDVFTWDYAIGPGVAERWDLSQDKLTYTFHLRSDAKWSNGEPVRASDFVYAWRRALLPDTASDYTGLFQLVRGAREFFEWRENATKQYAQLPAEQRTRAAAEALWDQTLRAFDSMVEISAPDDRTFTFTLGEPTPFFLDLCAFPVFYPVYPPLVRQYESIVPETGMLKIESGWTKPPTLVTNGPFVLTAWRFKRDMFFEVNPHYWDKGRLNIRTVKMVSIEDPNAQVLAFETGAVDWVSDVSPGYRGDMLAKKQAFYEEHRTLVDELRARGLDQFEIDRRLPPDPRKHIHAVPAFGTYWYNFNCLPTLPSGRDNPFKDARVRRAFAMALDKRAIADDVRRLGEPVARTIVPPNSIGGYRSPKGVDCLSDMATDAERQALLAEARKLLADAGYPDPKAFPTVEILFNKDGGHGLIAEAVQKQWARNLGVPVVLAQKEIKIFRDDLKKQNFMVSRAGWYGDYGDPTTFLDLSRSTDGNNDRKFASAEYDGLLDAARAELDPARRMEILHRCESMIMDEELPMVPLFHYVTPYLFNAERVSGLNPHPRADQRMDLIDILGDGLGAERSLQMPALPAAGGENTRGSEERR